MTKYQLIETFVKNHQILIDYIDQLEKEGYLYTQGGKWTAGQQLHHVGSTIVPFTKALVSKEYLVQKFGDLDRSTWSYQTVLDNYAKTSLKAPEQFLPPAEVSFEQKETIITSLHSDLKKISALLELYEEDELDLLVIPHPLLGKMNIREIFYLMGYHPIHHLKQIKTLLNNYEV
ncbi:DinB family protein [Sphingobacterium paucimobilis]|uniref:DinB-like domain-containing protein n=1 Tax=Sphingobacterium paucimobilis HER1398 TaxID=1346330 RepID=U2HZ57_9SPHI|nr:DinB family protein [Sphingobacterium paucimobilis]ERJ60842.1 hypothetical protein M472_18985 [Sphingobacterium paucimobilis HER1398]